VRRVTNQHHAAENRVLLINFHDWDTARLSGLIKQVGDRLDQDRRSSGANLAYVRRCQ
jgi:hypothetical protein